VRKKLVIFGAGKIGRSFIGQLFSRAGYQVTFIDIAQSIIDLLNQRNSYKVVIKAEKEEQLLIENVNGILATDAEAVQNAVAEADLLAVSVGKNGLKKVIPRIAEGVLLREKISPGRALDIIIAENMRDAAEFMREELAGHLPEGFHQEQRIGLVETSIGKMVPIMSKKDEEADPLQVFAEPYNTLIVDKKGFINSVPDIPGLSPKENMKAWVDRKSFVHNLGHAATAYLGNFYFPEKKYIYEVLDEPWLRQKIKATMQQAGEILQANYPEEFNQQAIDEHIDDLLMRFANRYLGDTVYRVGLDLPRKLGPEDRLFGAITLARALNKPYDNILKAAVAGTYFQATDEAGKLFPADATFRRIHQDSLIKILIEICKLDPAKDAEVFAQAKQIKKELEKDLHQHKSKKI